LLLFYDIVINIYVKYVLIDCFGYSIGTIYKLSLNENVSNVRSLLTVRVCQRELRLCLQRDRDSFRHL